MVGIIDSLSGDLLKDANIRVLSPFFASSHSAVQAVTAAPEKQKAAAEGPVFSESKHASHGIVARAKNLVSSENIVGTVMTLGFIKGWLDKTTGAWGLPNPLGNNTGPGLLPKIPGGNAVSSMVFGKGFDRSQLNFAAKSQKPQTAMEKTMAVGVAAGLVQNLAFFMTKRGGETPPGDNLWQKAVSSLKNPDKHSVHFSTVTMSGIIGLLSAGRVGMGLQGLNSMKSQYGSRGDFLASSDFKKNATLLASGVSGLVCAPMILDGMFKIKDKPEDKKSPDAGKGDAPAKPVKTGFINSLKPGHLKDMWQYALKHDKQGVAGRLLALGMELGFIVNGRLELAKDPTNGSAYKTVQGGMVGVALSLMQSHFVYDRLLNNSRQHAAPAR